jgi:hypothetical protein
MLQNFCVWIHNHSAKAVPTPPISSDPAHRATMHHLKPKSTKTVRHHSSAPALMHQANPCAFNGYAPALGFMDDFFGKTIICTL